MSWEPDDLTLLIDAARLLGPVGPEDPETAKPRRPLDRGGMSIKPAQLQAWLQSGQTAFFVVCGRQADCWDIEVEHLDDVRHIVAGFRGPLARSARGGVHLWTLPVKEGNRRLVHDGVHIGELKGRNGMVTIPPSVRPKGTYEWIRGPWRWPLLPAGPQLLALLPPPPTPSRRERPTTLAGARRELERVRAKVAAEPEGNRNSWLFWAASHLARLGFAEDAVARELLAAAEMSGLGEQASTATIRSGIRRGLADERQ